MKHLLKIILFAISVNAVAQENTAQTSSSNSQQGNNSVAALSTVSGVSGSNTVTGGVNSNNVTNSTVQGDAYSGTNNIQPKEQKVLTTSSIQLAPLTTSGMDTCHGSASGGVSLPGFNLSGGKTYIDENCVMLKNSKRLQELGLKDAALVLLMNSDERIKNAIKISNPDVYSAFYKD